MPDESYWESLFDIPRTLALLGIGRRLRDVAELGCGYGTFTIPVARCIRGRVFSFDIEPAMVALTRLRAAQHGLDNVRVVLRDVLADGFGLPDAACDACLLFNILHTPAPLALLCKAARILKPGGRVLVTHWRSDVPTLRGAPLNFRPTSAYVRHWAAAAGLVADVPIDLPPWQYGIALRR